MTDKEWYTNYCLKNDVIIFVEPWWLDAVCGAGNWNVTLVKENEVPQLIFPYYWKNKGEKIINMPHLTPYLDVIYTNNLSDIKESKRIATERKNLLKLVSLLDVNGFRQKLHYSFKNWLPFYWNGFEQSTRYTYVLDDIQNLDATFQNMDGNVRKQIRKSEKIVEVFETDNLNDFYTLQIKTFERQGLKPPYEFDFFEKLDIVLSNEKRRKIFLAKDKEGNIHGGVYIIWDNHSAYYLAGGADPEFRSSSAQTLLLWNAIKYCSSFVKKFDFEGSMVQGIEKFFSSFGAKQEMIFELKKGDLEAKKSRFNRIKYHSKEILKTLKN